MVVFLERIRDSTTSNALKKVYVFLDSPETDSNINRGVVPSVSMMWISHLYGGTQTFAPPPKSLLNWTQFRQMQLGEYGKATLEIHKDSIKAEEKVLVVDDLIATGGTAEAGAKLIEKSGGKVTLIK